MECHALLSNGNKKHPSSFSRLSYSVHSFRRARNLYSASPMTVQAGHRDCVKCPQRFLKNFFSHNNGDLLGSSDSSPCSLRSLIIKLRFSPKKALQWRVSICWGMFRRICASSVPNAKMYQMKTLAFREYFHRKKLFGSSNESSSESSEISEISGRIFVKLKVWTESNS